jgi:hypothetical protein
VSNTVAEGVEGEECHLEEAMEVDGGVVGHERCTEVKVPGHLSTQIEIIFFSLNYIDYRITHIQQIILSPFSSLLPSSSLTMNLRASLNAPKG